MTEDPLTPIATGLEIPCDVPGCNAWAEYQLKNPTPVEGSQGTYIRAVCTWHVELVKQFLSTSSPTKEVSPEPLITAQPPPLSTHLTPARTLLTAPQNARRSQRDGMTNWDILLKRIRARVPNCILISTIIDDSNPEKRVITWSHNGKKGELQIIIPEEDIIITSLFKQILHQDDASHQDITSKVLTKATGSSNDAHQINNHIKLTTPDLDAYT